MLSPCFGAFGGDGPDRCGQVDLVPCSVSDFTASGRGEGQELERGDRRPTSLGCFDRPNSSADHVVG